MAYEINIEARSAEVELLTKAGNKALIMVDGKKYDIDIAMVEKGVYSIIYNGHSYNVELIEGDTSKKYVVNTFVRTFNVTIVDAETKYQRSRQQGMDMEGANDLSSPMPGKVVRIPVTVGDNVTAGQTLIIVEAMKMQSEFKATADRVVKDILVKEGDTVEAHQVMIRLG